MRPCARLSIHDLTLPGTLLQIVNFNVEGQQYVCAGELVALQTMTNVLNYLKIQKIDIAKLTEQFTVEKVKEMLGDIVEECFGRAQDQQKAQGHIKLERGFTTIPLLGIDMPLHSRYLWVGVLLFRAYLLPRLDKVLKKWGQENWASAEKHQKLACIILFELFAYQFASSVCGIQTQDRWSRTRLGQLLSLKLPAAAVTSVAATAGAPRAVALAAPSGPVATIDNFPVKVIHVFTAIVAQKLKKKINEISLSKSIKDLVGSKSTLQNEIFSDLQLKFTSAPEKGEEPLLEDLASAFLWPQCTSSCICATSTGTPGPGETALVNEKANGLALQTKPDNVAKEHGDVYIEGIQLMFDPIKVRRFDLNWARQDALLMFYDIIFGRLTTVDCDITARCIALMNRADAEVLAYMQYNIGQMDPTKGETYALAKKPGQQLIDNVREVIGEDPFYMYDCLDQAPLLEPRRLAVYLSKQKDSRWDPFIALSKNGRLFKNAMTTAAVFGSTKIAEQPMSTLQCFTQPEKEVNGRRRKCRRSKRIMTTKRLIGGLVTLPRRMG
ncbi:Fatty acid synthase [Mycena indigotica]|uniref:Fatty acid synthase n=1 Tax=Mycena indigotica TaxID=2126181 RepID=A0A8H6S6D6_9AGAR|nr:Fatty acid synthase [Mycena indigotica]KAF7292916.1 Fatty acid synthase [Mycena indigotica]